MAAQQLPTMLHYLRRLVHVSSVGGLGDGQLLARFVTNRDEAAFEVLVWRHGPMVLSVCRRVLGKEHDAEDAFQATFLTLARKAGSIGRREAVGSWLYKVAYRIALAARCKNARMASHETPLHDAVAADRSVEFQNGDWRPVIDEEILRLPPRYRIPFVLCCLEGKTVDEAAKELGCPRGTVGTRVARAKARLRVRLERRGVTASASALAISMGMEPASAGVRLSLVTSTVQAGIAFAANSATGAVAAPVAALTRGELHAMFVAKLKKIATLVVLVTIVGGSASGIAFQTVIACPTNGAAGSTGNRTIQSGASAQESAADSPNRDQRASEAEIAEALAALDEAEFRYESSSAKISATKQTYETAQKIAEQSRHPAVALAEREKMIDQLNSQHSFAEWIQAYNESKAAERARNAQLRKALTIENRLSPQRGLQTFHWVIGPAPSSRTISAKTNAFLVSVFEAKPTRRVEFPTGDQLSLIDLPLAADAEIYINGKAAKYADLKPGMLGCLRFVGATPVIAKITVEPLQRQLLLKVTDLVDKSLTVDLDGRDWTLPLGKSASVLIGGQARGFGDLKPGMQVLLLLGESEGGVLAVMEIRADR